MRSIEELNAIMAGVGVKTPSSDGTPFILVPEGYHLEDLTRLQPEPLYVNMEKHVIDVDSFSKYVNTFKEEDTAIFASLSHNTVSAVIDHHGKGKPRHGKHVVMLDPQVSEAWKTWSGINGQYMSQASFAEFIEENAIDVRTPEAATLVELALLIEASKQGTFRSATRLDNGSFQFNYSEETRATAGGGKVEIPAQITLGIPVYEGDEPYEVKAFFRYRLSDGKLALCIKLHRPSYILQDAYNRLVKQVTEKCSGVPIYNVI